MKDSQNLENRKNEKKWLIKISYFLVCAVSFLLIANTIRIPLFNIIIIDQNSILLIVLIIILLFIPYITHFKYGDFEFDIDPQEIKELEREHNKNFNLINEVKEIKIPKETPQIFNQISELVDSDHILALAKLRMELEKLLNNLYNVTINDKNEKPSRRYVPLIQKIRYLREQEIIPGPVSGDIHEVLTICNRAIHGEEIRQKDAKIVIDVGFDVLKYLFELNDKYSGQKLDSVKISHEELKNYLDAKYQVTTVIPYVDNPQKNVQIVDQAGLDNLLEGYSEYSEVVVEVTKVENKK